MISRRMGKRHPMSSTSYSSRLVIGKIKLVLSSSRHAIPCRPFHKCTAVECGVSDSSGSPRASTVMDGSHGICVRSDAGGNSGK